MVFRKQKKNNKRAKSQRAKNGGSNIRFSFPFEQIKDMIQEKRESIGELLPDELKKFISGLVLLIASLIVFLAFFGKAGPAGSFFADTLFDLAGRSSFVIPILLLISGLIFVSTRYKSFFWPILLAAVLALIGVTGLFESIYPGDRMGGLLGYVISWPIMKLFGQLVSEIVFGSVLVIAGIIFVYFFHPEKEEEEPTEEPALPKPPSLMKRMFAPKFHVKQVEKDDKEEPAEKRDEAGKKEPLLDVRQEKLLQSNYESPPLSLLEPARRSSSGGDIKSNSLVIKKTLEDFGIDVEMAEANIGPTVTQYSFKPAQGVKVSKITGLSNDLALALAAHPIRIEAPIPGKPLVGVEVPNTVKAEVRLRTLFEQQSFQNNAPNLLLVLGLDVSGNPMYADLSRMPHLLVAGATGSGKTIYLNTILLSLIHRNSPEIMRLILVDPKRVEFPVYNDLPHLLCPVIHDATKTVNALRWLISEMERRFQTMSEVHARDIGGYNAIMAKEKKSPMPYIVVVIDELADLMAAKGKDIEAGIVRLAQMARAVGIHLIVATQRPSVEVITGLIKANITSRISFQLASQFDSRTVLDMSGAEKLLGAGDMLYLSSEFGKPKRIQSPYVSEKEVKRSVNWIESKNEETEFATQEGLEDDLAQELEKVHESSEVSSGEGDLEDPLYEEARQMVIDAQKASASLLQRRLKVGYARAARLLDILEEKGVVGPGEGAKPREVYVQNEDQDTSS